MFYNRRMKRKTILIFILLILSQIIVESWQVILERPSNKPNEYKSLSQQITKATNSKSKLKDKLGVEYKELVSSRSTLRRKKEEKWKSSVDDVSKQRRKRITDDNTQESKETQENQKNPVVRLIRRFNSQTDINEIAENNKNKKEQRSENKENNKEKNKNVNIANSEMKNKNNNNNVIKNEQNANKKEKIGHEMKKNNEEKNINGKKNSLKKRTVRNPTLKKKPNKELIIAAKDAYLESESKKKELLLKSKEENKENKFNVKEQANGEKYENFNNSHGDINKEEKIHKVENNESIEEKKNHSPKFAEIKESEKIIEHSEIFESSPFEQKAELKIVSPLFKAQKVEKQKEYYAPVLEQKHTKNAPIEQKNVSLHEIKERNKPEVFFFGEENPRVQLKKRYNFPQPKDLFERPNKIMHEDINLDESLYSEWQSKDFLETQKKITNERLKDEYINEHKIERLQTICLNPKSDKFSLKILEEVATGLINKQFYEKHPRKSHEEHDFKLLKKQLSEDIKKLSSNFSEKDEFIERVLKKTSSETGIEERVYLLLIVQNTILDLFELHITSASWTERKLTESQHETNLKTLEKMLKSLEKMKEEKMCHIESDDKNENLEVYDELLSEYINFKWKLSPQAIFTKRQENQLACEHWKNREKTEKRFADRKKTMKENIYAYNKRLEKAQKMKEMLEKKDFKQYRPKMFVAKEIEILNSRILAIECAIVQENKAAKTLKMARTMLKELLKEVKERTHC